MWYDDLRLGASWAALWTGYTICLKCSAIRQFEIGCPICNAPTIVSKQYTMHVEGRGEVLVQEAFTGAEGRYEDWVFLQMLEREWKRPTIHPDSSRTLPASQGPSQRAAVVLLFWSYFETRIERLLREALRDLPPRMLEDALRRYSFIGSRLNQFYRIAFDTTYEADLRDLGFEEIASFLNTVQERRNDFVHGMPQAIDDSLVASVVKTLKAEHESWISVYNKRVARLNPPTV
jgi:hypothetical protein